MSYLRLTREKILLRLNNSFFCAWQIFSFLLYFYVRDIKVQIFISFAMFAGFTYMFVVCPLFPHDIYIKNYIELKYLRMSK